MLSVIFFSLLGAMNIYQPVLRHNNFAKVPDTHFARDTHMRIILGNSSGFPLNKDKKTEQQENSNSKSRYVLYCLVDDIPISSLYHKSV